MKIYLASPFWNEKERTTVSALAQLLRADGEEVFVPMEHEIENGWNMSNMEWAGKVFKMDTDAIDAADLIIACVYGYTDDSGTAWECGYAFAKGKPVRLVNCGDADSIHSLMVWCGSVNFNEDGNAPELK